jgi:ADP-ribose pyrophosphatase YjhB (NUDIX family)
MEKSYIKYLREMVGHKMVMLISATVCIVNDKNQILLQKRSDNQLWGLPGGLIELDETLEEAAIREVKEETNLDIEIERFIGVFVNPRMVWNGLDEAKVYSFGFLGKVIGGDLKINDSESLELKYFDYQNLPTIHSVDNLEQIHAYFKDISNIIEGKIY